MTDPPETARALAAAPLPSEDVGIIDELRALEELKCAAEARQARLAAALDLIRSPRTPNDEEPSTFAEVALARRVSASRGRKQVALARVLHLELPHTKAAFDAGLISEWRATIIAKETACLSYEHRAQVDEHVARDAVELSGRGDRETSVLIQQLAARLDAAAVARRRRRAESERRVGVRPAPDAMAYLTALLPVAQAVGIYATLKAAADTAVGIGKATSHGAAMADELVRRVTGVGDGVPQPVALRLTMSADALFGDGEDPAFLTGYGPIPADAGRALLADNVDAGVKVWLKRLFTRPETGELIAMDSRSRLFPKALGEFLELRDRWCRTPWCDAPIRHHDHVRPHAAGGPTSACNGQGLCEACNQAKEAAGWTSETVPGPRHTVLITTPSGHQYRSRAPAA